MSRDQLLDEAIAKVRELPEAQQDLAAEVLLSVVDQEEPTYRLTPEQVREVGRIQEDLRTGRATLASDQQVAALWKKCGL
jgi:hypothetical protein